MLRLAAASKCWHLNVAGRSVKSAHLHVRTGLLKALPHHCPKRAGMIISTIFIIFNLYRNAEQCRFPCAANKFDLKWSEVTEKVISILVRPCAGENEPSSSAFELTSTFSFFLNATTIKFSEWSLAGRVVLLVVQGSSLLQTAAGRLGAIAWSQPIVSTWYVNLILSAWYHQPESK